MRHIQEHPFLEKLGQLERDSNRFGDLPRLRPLPFQYAGLESLEHRIRERQRR